MKRILKKTVELATLVAVLPPFLVYWLECALLGPERAFPGWSQAFSLIPGLTGVYFRREFYRLVVTRCAPGATISFGTVFSHKTCAIGRDTYIGVFCVIGDVTLEDDVLIGSHVSIMNGSAQHGIER